MYQVISQHGTASGVLAAADSASTNAHGYPQSERLRSNRMAFCGRLIPEATLRVHPRRVQLKLLMLDISLI
jgi:hypothetical protein